MSSSDNNELLKLNMNKVENGPTVKETNSAERDANQNSSHLGQYIYMLKHAGTDTEKFLALLMVAKWLKNDDLDESSKRELLDAIGLKFLGRMLQTTEVPDDCPPYMFRSIALTILSCFTSSCHGNPALHQLIPSLAEIISKPELYEDDLTQIKEAYQCLSTIASEKSGKNAIIDFEIIDSLVDAYIAENMFHEQALEIIRQIALEKDNKIWEDQPEAFDKLIEYLCQQFECNHSAHKFFLCGVIADIIPSMPDKYLSAENGTAWKKSLHHGLKDILFSKLNQDLRLKGLYLAASVLQSLGVSWVIATGEKGQQLLLLMVHLSCIEVRMTLEDKTFHEAINTAHQRMVTSCYAIIEEAIKFLINGAIDLDEKQKQQLYSALKGAFNGVLIFLNSAALEDISSTKGMSQMFTYASIRVLGAWLAEETSANKDEVYNILPFLIEIAKSNFIHNNAQESVPKSKKKGLNRNVIPQVKTKKEELPDLLRFLLPGLCHLTAEDTPRTTLLDLGIETLLYDYLVCQWNNVYNEKREPDGLYRRSDLIITICNIIMNIVVQEPDRVKAIPIYYRILKFIFSKVFEIPVDSHYTQLSGSLCTLGLMIFRHQYPNLQNTELSVFKFVQATVRFLWEAYNVEESPDFATMVVSAAYESCWTDLVELWFLSIHALTILLPLVPWICDFLIESEWPQTIVETLLQVKDSGIDTGLKTAYEDFLCMLIETSEGARGELVLKGIETVSVNHKMEKLRQCLKCFL